MKNYIFQIVLSLSLFASSAYAQNTSGVKPESFVDIEREQGLISVPYWLRGLQFAAKSSELRPILLVIAPKYWANQRICANATTINGRYLATGEYILPNDVGKRAIQLLYQTKFPDLWSKSTVKNSGVVVSEGNCDKPVVAGSEGRLLPAVFNGQGELIRDSANRALLIMNIHARNTQELIVTVLFNDAPEPASCKKLSGSDAIQFNFSCEIAVPSHISGESRITVTRLNRGRKAKPQSVEIILPDLR